MPKFPIDASKRDVIRAFENLGFVIVREREHIAMVRHNADETRTPLTLPNHKTIKGSTLRRICSQIGVSRETFLKAFKNR
jgi:predicted RNA binding protein YcfA (HicA-like mRNA interferase family)